MIKYKKYLGLGFSVFILSSCSQRYGPTAEVEMDPKEGWSDAIERTHNHEDEIKEHSTAPSRDLSMQEKQEPQDEMPYVKEPEHTEQLKHDDKISNKTEGDEKLHPFDTKKTNPEKESIKEPPKTSRIFVWPLKGAVQNKFGEKLPGNKKNEKADFIAIKAQAGSRVSAPQSGKVLDAGKLLPGYGEMVLIKHDDGKITVLSHLDRVFVRKGDQLLQGDDVGRIGDKPLRFSVRVPVKKNAKKSKPVDPASLLTSSTLSSDSSLAT